MQYNEYMPQTLSFKGKNSAVSTKIYDKTKEMEDTKRKPHIINLWKDSGLNTDKRIWRLEVSMTSDAKRIVALETGEYMELKLRDLRDLSFIQSLYFSMVSVYFKWHISGTATRKHNCKVLPLFSPKDVAADYRRHKVVNCDGFGKRERRINAILKKAYQCSNGDLEHISTIDRMYEILFDNYEYIWDEITYNPASNFIDENPRA